MTHFFALQYSPYIIMGALLPLYIIHESLDSNNPQAGDQLRLGNIIIYKSFFVDKFAEILKLNASIAFIF